jgi:hypothetical protein
VVPTTDLLKQDLREQLSELYAKRLSYCPPLMHKPTEKYASYDDTQHSSRVVSSVIVRTINRFGSLSVTYLDGGESNKHGVGGGDEKVFQLINGMLSRSTPPLINCFIPPTLGEHITDMIIWIHEDSISGLQFVTNSGRCSPHFGGHDGAPTVARSKGGILVGFISLVHNHPQWGHLLSRVQVSEDL